MAIMSFFLVLAISFAFIPASSEFAFLSPFLFKQFTVDGTIFIYAHNKFFTHSFSVSQVQQVGCSGENFLLFAYLNTFHVCPARLA